MTVIAKYTFNGSQLVGSAAANASHSGMVGIEMINSMILWMTMSIIPPK